MKQTKRLFAVLLAVVMLLGVVPVMQFSANALSPTYSVSTGYASSSYYTSLCNVVLTGNQRRDIVAVAQSQLGYHEGDNSRQLSGNYSGSGNYTEYGYWYGLQDEWCAMFVSWCARQANIPTSILKNSTCAGVGESNFNLSYKDGASYTPKQGDLFFTKEWTHVGLVASVSGSTFTTIEGNSSNSVASNTYSISNYYFGVPDYTGDENTFADLGEQFYAVILNTKYWKPISLNTSTNKITLETEKNVAYQKWRFTRQDDGAYRIESCANGKVLEMTNGEREDRTQLTAHDDWWGGYYQQWYLIPRGDGYIFQSKHYSGEQWVMDLRGSSNNDGSIIQIYQRNDGYADDETWSVYAGNEVQLKATKLNVTVGTDATKTTFKWNNVYGATHFNIKIWKDKVDNSVSTYHSGWKVNSGYSVQLPPGKYEAYVDTCDNYQCLRSNQVSFTVPGNTASNTPANLGDDFYAVILSNESWKPIANDYVTDNYVRLQTSEHENNSAHQLWRFQRQSDGSYAISSTQDGKYLEFHNGNRVENAPVSAHNQTFWDGAYQKWWIYQNSSGGYFFESAHYTSQGWYMTLKDNDSADGTPITMCSLTGQNNQIWAIYRQSEVQMKAPTLMVEAGTASTPTQFSWDHVFGAKEFQIKVWRNQYNANSDPDYSQTVTSTSGSIQLPAGTYEARVEASNYWQSFESQSVTFKINAATYQIAYNYNGGNGQPMTQTKVYGEDLTLSSVKPYRTGYVFSGWNTKSDGTGSSYALGGTYRANESATMYAMWTACSHNWNEGTITKAPTCSTTGTKVCTCTICNATKTETISVNANNHINTAVIDATPSTCTVKGYSEGIYCNDCKRYISGHETQPLAAHTLTTVNQRAATCTAEGYTGDQYCTVCKQTISTGTTIAKKAHTLTTINHRDATYDAEGYTGDQYCTTCQQTISTGTTIPKLVRPEPQPQPSGSCKWCGQNHGGAFGWLVRIFHNLFAAIFGARY